MCCFFCLMIRRPPRSTQSRSSAASDVYKRQGQAGSKTATPTAKPEVFAIGDVVKAGDIQVTINKAFDIQPAEYYSPEAGNRFIGIDATLSLIHISEPTRPY